MNMFTRVRGLITQIHILLLPLMNFGTGCGNSTRRGDKEKMRIRERTGWASENLATLIKELNRCWEFYKSTILTWKRGAVGGWLVRLKKNDSYAKKERRNPLTPSAKLGVPIYNSAKNHCRRQPPSPENLREKCCPRKEYSHANNFTTTIGQPSLSPLPPSIDSYYRYSRSYQNHRCPTRLSGFIGPT